LSAAKEKDYLVCLDKSGKSFNTLGLKSKFENWLMSANNLTFLIGGPDGVSKECLDKCNESWSLSPLTFPHVIVPVLIIEQIYRVWSITQNHPYHR
jgi:23S rRNA (pseudouridine1915-N3)-methyltransferase